MSRLALHATDAVGSIAVERQDGEIVASEFEAHGDKAPVLLLQIDRVLRRAGLDIASLREIAVTTGPGSFTGIRIGLATAQGLGVALGSSILACDSLRAWAAAQAAGQGPTAIILDARRGEVYAALYDEGAGGMPRVRLDPACLAPEAAARFLAGGLGPAEAVRLAGTGRHLVEAELGSRGIAIADPSGGAEPIAVALLRLVRAGGCVAVSPADLEPTYLRLSDAEARRRQGG